MNSREDGEGGGLVEEVERMGKGEVEEMEKREVIEVKGGGGFGEMEEVRMIGIEGEWEGGD